MNTINHELVSVIIPTKNPNKEIFSKCLNSIFSQTHSNIEIIIVDASIKKLEILSEFKKIIYVRQKGKNVSGARQDGLDAANGKYVVGLDSDCIAKQNWIEEIINSFDEKNQELIIIGKSLPMTESSVETNIQEEYSNWMNHIACDLMGKYYSLTIDSKNYGFIAEYGKQIGFDESLLSAEDMDFATRSRRKGYKIIYNPNAILYHLHKQSHRDLIRQKIWHGTGYGQNMVKNNIDFEMHFQMRNLLKLFGGIIFFPFTAPIFLYHLVRSNKQERSDLFFKNIFYWSFIWGTLKGMYKEGGIRFLLMKLKSDLFLNLNDQEFIYL